MQSFQTIYDAAKNKDEASLTSFSLNSASVDQRDNQGFTVASKLASEGHFDAFKLLLIYNPDLTEICRGLQIWIRATVPNDFNMSQDYQYTDDQLYLLAYAGVSSEYLIKQYKDSADSFRGAEVATAKKGYLLELEKYYSPDKFCYLAEIAEIAITSSWIKEPRLTQRLLSSITSDLFYTRFTEAVLSKTKSNNSTQLIFTYDFSKIVSSATKIRHLMQNYGCDYQMAEFIIKPFFSTVFRLDRLLMHEKNDSRKKLISNLLFIECLRSCSCLPTIQPHVMVELKNFIAGKNKLEATLNQFNTPINWILSFFKPVPPLDLKNRIKNTNKRQFSEILAAEENALPVHGKYARLSDYGKSISEARKISLS